MDVTGWCEPPPTLLQPFARHLGKMKNGHPLGFLNAHGSRYAVYIAVGTMGLPWILQT